MSPLSLLCLLTECYLIVNEGTSNGSTSSITISHYHAIGLCAVNNVSCYRRGQKAIRSPVPPMAHRSSSHARKELRHVARNETFATNLPTPQMQILRRC